MSQPRRMRLMRLGLSLGSVGCHDAAWRHPSVPADGDMDFRHIARCAQIAEAGKLDFIVLADVAAVPDLDDPRVARHREQGHVKLEPLMLVAALAAVTDHVGLVPTVSTGLHHPFALARRLASIDHLSQGRAGWTMVTDISADEAGNYSQDGASDSATRYERAREFLAVVQGLFDGWEPGAFPRDLASGLYMDPARMHRLNHLGRHFKVRGPSDVDRPPQGALPLITAGTSDDAQDLAAEVADMVYGGQPTIEGARTHYASVKARLPGCGRSADSLRMMPGIMPVIGRTQGEAEDLFASLQDRLLPEAAPGVLAIPRVFEAVSRGFRQLRVVGTPGQVADVMEEWFSTAAADGFIVQPPLLPLGADGFVRLVVPELQRRGLFRTEYEGSTLRENLGLHAAVPRQWAGRDRLEEAR